MVEDKQEYIPLDNKPTLFIDTDSNRRGELISMAIVGRACRYSSSELTFYQAICPVGGVQNDHVERVLEIPLIDRETFRYMLHLFLRKFQYGFTIIANCALDLKYFLSMLHLGGERFQIPDFDLKLLSSIEGNPNRIEHNALHDARALMNQYYSKIWKEATSW